MAEGRRPTPKGPAVALRSLKRIAILKGLAPEILEKLEANCRWRSFEANDQVFDEDDRSNEVYFVVRGSVRVVHYSEGGQQVGISECGVGGVIGELSAVDGKTRSASVFSDGKSVLAIADRSTFTGLLKEHPEVALRLLVHLATVIRAMNERVINLSVASDVQRVYYELLRRAEPDLTGSGDWVVKNVPRHKDLAERLGTEPETVAHAVSQLMKANLVKRQSGNLQLLDRAKIQELAIEL